VNINNNNNNNNNNMGIKQTAKITITSNKININNINNINNRNNMKHNVKELRHQIKQNHSEFRSLYLLHGGHEIRRNDVENTEVLLNLGLILIILGLVIGAATRNDVDDVQEQVNQNGAVLGRVLQESVFDIRRVLRSGGA
jgi:hypothetical protein